MDTRGIKVMLTKKQTILGTILFIFAVAMFATGCLFAFGKGTDFSNTVLCVSAVIVITIIVLLNTDKDND